MTSEQTLDDVQAARSHMQDAADAIATIDQLIVKLEEPAR